MRRKSVLDLHRGGATKTLVITGDGTTMDDFDLDMSPNPWSDDVKIIDMSGAPNMTNVGTCAFDSKNITKVIFGPALATIGENAFTYYDTAEDKWKECSFYWHNGNVFDEKISTAEMAGRTFQSKDGKNFWMTDVKVDDPLILDDTFKGTITEVFSQYSCSVRIDGLMPGKSLPSDGTLNVVRSISIWTNTGSTGYMDGLCNSIGENAFAGQTDLKKLDVGPNNKSIGASAFKGCTNLKELTVSINVDLSTGKPFEGCANIEKITFTKGIGDETGRGFDYNHASAANTPMGISKARLSTVILAPGIEKIGDYTFYECKELKEISLPSGLEEIGERAFSSSGLISLSTPESLKNIGKFAFSICKSLTSADIKGTDLKVSRNAFSDCTALASLTLGEGIIELGNLAFSDTAVSAARLPDSLNSIVGDAFLDCPKLSGFEVKDSNTRYSVDSKGVLYTKDGKTVVAAPRNLSGTYSVRDGTETIGDYAFRGNLMGGVILPSSTTSVGTWAFHSCAILDHVDAPGVKDISKGAFCNVKNLKTFYAPSLETVAPDAFTNGVTFWLGTRGIACDSDEFKAFVFWSSEEDGKLYAGAEVSGIRYRTSEDGESAFAVFCGDLKDVTIPDTVAIGTETYRVTDIGRLLGSTALIETLSIGANVTGINSEDAFDRMQNLRGVSVSSDNAEYASFDGLLYSKDMKTLLRCPVDKSLPVKFASGLEIVGSYAFYDCKNVSGLVLPMGVKSISPGAFAFNINAVISSFTLPPTLEDISSNAFDYGFYYGNGSPLGVEDIRGHSWKLNEGGDGYVRGIVVPAPIGGNVSLDAPYGELELDAQAIENMNGSSATVTMEGGTVFFDAAAVRGLKPGALTMCLADTSGYSDALKAKIGDRPVFAVNFGDNKKFDGKVNVSFAYVLRDGESADNVYVVFVNTETGELEKMGGTWSDGYVTFETDHFSDYAIMYSEDGSENGGSNSMLFVGIGVAAAVAVLFLALYFLHIGPFARKD